RNCLQLRCTLGKMLYNETCVEVLKELRVLPYSLLLWLVLFNTDIASNNQTNVENLTDAIRSKVKTLLHELSNSFSLHIQAFHNKNSGNGTTPPNIFSIDAKIVSDKTLSRCAFEKMILDIFLNSQFVVKTGDIKSQVMTFDTYPAYQTLLMAENTFVKNKYSVFSCQPSEEENDSQQYVNRYINVTLLLLCRHVHFHSGSYQMNVDYGVLPPDVQIEIDLFETTIYITDQRDLKMVDVDEDGGLNVCVELLDKLIGQQQQSFLSLMSKTSKGTDLVEYIVSLVCFVASIICLILTLLTYVIFPVLRTEAGINNMFLSGSLLLAQVSSRASSHSKRSSTLCTALGVLTHFLWLWNFTWSFICSYHMYKVLVPSSTTVQPRKLWMTILCSVLFPTLITVTTIVLSFVIPNGQIIRYGFSLCYLNTAFLFGVTMISSLSALTVINILFFAVTVYKLRKAENRQSSLGPNGENNSWFIYMIIFSAIGSFWTVAILDAYIDSVVLGILSTILNGLQGVTIFIAFICNKRVVSLYREKRTSKQISRQEENQIQA
ncbi:adhesion G protein-coupled receptor E4P, partial [Biomphalaria glabrata]